MRPHLSELEFRPRLPGFLERMQASLRVRGGRISITVERSSRGNSCVVNGQEFPFPDARCRIPYPADGAVVLLRIGS
jgi:cellobiose phosphorylase